MAKVGKSRKWVYFFGGGKAEGRGDQRALLGGKGAGLAEMTRIGLPVPAGFTLTTEACAVYNEAGQVWPKGLEKEVRAHLSGLERRCKKKLGSALDPLLVSVRSGAARSMPGMMETVLNIGLNDRSVQGLALVSGNERFALDSYRRLLMMYGTTVRHISREHFDRAFTKIKDVYTRERLGRSPGENVGDTEVNAEELEKLIAVYRDLHREHGGAEFAQDPFEQLRGAITAVFDSWMAEKALTYRRVEKITGLTGTAVNVCQMVFGNTGDDSGTGVCFTRDPSTGFCEFYGDLLINAQGEDVVAGVRTPLRLAELAERMPEVYEQLDAVRVMLEVHYKEMQDLEFTIERGKLYMLQCRIGKRSPQAAFRIAVEQATKGLMSPADVKRLVRKRYLPVRYAKAAAKPVISKDEAIARITAADVERLFYPVLDPDLSSDRLDRARLGEGIGAVPGAASGVIVFSADEAETRSATGDKVILVRKETSPEDVGGMYVAAGILTATGGKTSHAAVVARGWGKCCVVGCEGLSIDYAARSMRMGGRTLNAGACLTLDGTSGAVYADALPLVLPEAPPEYETLMQWCDERRKLRVRANADTPADARRAVELGAEGIGLCRTEHMFFDPSEPARIRAMREMILADSTERRRGALAKLLPYQCADFEGIFEAMEGRPVTVRLIDPPLHEFLPQDDNTEGQQALVDDINAAIEASLSDVAPWDQDRRRALECQKVDLAEVRRRVARLHETNPMLGHRGCRLCITFPEILEMQVRAIVTAAARCVRRGTPVRPEIMIPLSIDDRELSLLVEQTRRVADETLSEFPGVGLPYLVGTMIETPRAALLAGRLAAVSEFFSFGTNDLTQMTMGLSRDDAGRFLPDYVDEAKTGIFKHDPFQTLDEDGVGLLVEGACAQGRAARVSLKLGVCGEHGGDPTSIRFLADCGLDYVSCSPPRVPVARLAAAQAALGSRPRRVLLKMQSKPKSMVGGMSAIGRVRPRVATTAGNKRRSSPGNASSRGKSRGLATGRAGKANRGRGRGKKR